MSDRRFLAACAMLFAVAACAGPKDGQLYTSDPPKFDGFEPVSDALEVHCGTLDCHGSSYRNFRIYGIYGQRLDHGTSGKGATTADEYTATYQSLIAIQPEVLSELVMDHAARPERWIVVTKGRGAENHKGKSRMHAGDATDTCLLSWVAGAEVQDACNQAAAVLPPHVDGGF
jgi:hypothetical protein